MGTLTTLTAADGHRFSAYQAGFDDAPRALVVVQEIFGVNHHIRAVADGFADAGYKVIAPAIFDRAEAGIELDYDEAGMKRGIALMQRIPDEKTIADLLAAADALGHAKVGIVADVVERVQQPGGEAVQAVRRGQAGQGCPRLHPVHHLRHLRRGGLRTARLLDR